MTSSIYTRNGDRGSTSLADGTVVSKYSLRLEGYGTIDEANAHVGVAIASIQEQLGDSDASADNESLNLLRKLQEVMVFLSHRLFNCSSCLAHGESPVPSSIQITPEDVSYLEGTIDFFEEHTGALKGFILCGGTVLAAELHVARTVMRRAERHICRLFESEAGDENLLRFVNRSSDVLFAASRFANFVLGEPDVLWKKKLAFSKL